MGATAAVALVVGGGISAYSSYQSGRAARSTGNFNASVQDMQADDALQRGALAERQQRMQTRGLIGAQRAAYAGQGVELDDGTALSAQTDSAGMGELDALIIRNNAAREAWGYRVGSANSRYEGRNAARAANTQALATLATSGSSAYSAYRQGNGWS